MTTYDLKTISPQTSFTPSTGFLFGVDDQSSSTPAPYTGTSIAAAMAASSNTLTNKAFDTAGTGNSFKINGTSITDKTGTGKAVLDTSATLVTPLLGTPTSGTLTNCTGLPVSTGISGFGTGIATALAANVNGSGAISLTTSPTFVTPVLGAATATSINGLAITSSTGTLTVTNLKTLSVSNTLTLAGTDGSTLNVGAGGTVAYVSVADQTITGGANVTSLSQSTGSIAIDCGARPLQYITNGGAYTITAPSSDGSCALLVTNNGSAGSTTFSGFSVGSNTGDALDTTNTHKFVIIIYRINGTSTYSIKALQ